LTDDLFDEPDRGYGVRAGRYRFPAPPGVEEPSNGWMRATNLVSAFSDQKALQDWLERMTLLGLLAHDGTVFDELAALPDEKLTPETLKEFGQKARLAAGAEAGARRGTARHGVLEHYLDTGEIGGHRRMKLQMEQLLEEMERHELDFIPGWSERVVWHPIAGGVMGRLDVRVMCQRTGQVGILDLKTQRRFWTYQEVAGQQCLYDSAEWVWDGPEDERGRWVRYQVNPAMAQQFPSSFDDQNTLMGRPGGMCEGKRVAILAHMPSNGGPVQLHEVDLAYGAQVLSLAAQIVNLRSRGKSVVPGRGIGGLRPSYTPAILDA